MLRSLWSVAVMAVATVLFGVPAIVASLAYPPSHATMRLGKVWSRWILRAAGVRVAYHGLEHVGPSAGGSRVFICNHQSMIDIWCTIAVLPASTVFVAKRSLFRVPVLGWSMAAAGFVPVDRDSRNRAIRSLGVAVDRVRSGRPLVLFAEGTRSRDGRLGPFKKGPFHVALQAGVPVVPVAIAGSWRSLPPGALLPRPGRVHVSFAPPMVVDRFAPDDVEGLSAAVREVIARRLERGDAFPGRAAEAGRS